MDCPICHKPLAGQRTWGVGKVTFCAECYEAQVWPKRKARMGVMLADKQRDCLDNRRREMREAIQERDRFRQNVADLKLALYREVRSEVVNEFRRLSFWRRLVLLFNPFGGE